MVYNVCLRRRPAAARLLDTQFRIPLIAWMLIFCVFCVSSSLCDKLITYREESYCVCVCVCVIVCELETSKRGGPDPIWDIAPQKKYRSYEDLFIYNSREHPA